MDGSTLFVEGHKRGIPFCALSERNCLLKNNNPSVPSVVKRQLTTKGTKEMNGITRFVEGHKRGIPFCVLSEMKGLLKNNEPSVPSVVKEQATNYLPC